MSDTSYVLGLHSLCALGLIDELMGYVSVHRATHLCENDAKCRDSESASK